jgi:hypothetical protein
MITMGYSVLDLIDGLSLGPDFVAHGAATLTIMGFFVYQNIPHVIVPMLLMEVRWSPRSLPCLTLDIVQMKRI